MCHPWRWSKFLTRCSQRAATTGSEQQQKPVVSVTLWRQDKRHWQLKDQTFLWFPFFSVFWVQNHRFVTMNDEQCPDRCARFSRCVDQTTFVLFLDMQFFLFFSTRKTICFPRLNEKKIYKENVCGVVRKELPALFIHLSTRRKSHTCVTQNDTLVAQCWHYQSPKCADISFEKCVGKGRCVCVFFLQGGKSTSELTAIISFFDKSRACAGLAVFDGMTRPC